MSRKIEKAERAAIVAGLRYYRARRDQDALDTEADKYTEDAIAAMHERSEAFDQFLAAFKKLESLNDEG